MDRFDAEKEKPPTVPHAAPLKEEAAQASGPPGEGNQLEAVPEIPPAQPGGEGPGSQPPKRPASYAIRRLYRPEANCN